jgi:hypothetical protein
MHLLPQPPQLLLSIWVQTFWPLHITGLAQPPDDEDAVVLLLEAAVVLELEAAVVLELEAAVVLLLLLDAVVVVELEDVVEPPPPPPDVLELDGVAPPFDGDPPRPTMPPEPPLPVDEGPLFVVTPPVPVEVAWVLPLLIPLPPASQPTIVPTTAKEASTAVEVTGFIHLFRALRIIGAAS